MCLFKGKIYLVLLGFSFVLSITGLKGQFYPLSDHYYDNTLLLNPAAAGSDDALSISLLYRNQWVGMNGSPKTMSFVFHSPIYSNLSGLGLFIQNDSYGIHRNTKFSGNYAHKIHLYKGTLAFGMAVNVTTMQQAWDDLVVVEADDEQLFQEYSNYIIPNFGTGIYYKAKRIFAGLSVPNLLYYEWENSKNKYEASNNFSEHNYFCYLGVHFGRPDQIEFIPSTLIRYSKAGGAKIDITSQINFLKKLGIGFSYRSEGGLIGIFNCKINNQAKISYSYGYETGKNLGYVGGSHEIGLKYIFKYELNVESPR